MDYLLREWRMSDAEDLVLAINNKAVQDNLRDGIPYPYTESDARDYIQSVLDAAPDSRYEWTIEMEGRAAGSIGIFRRDNIHRRTAELGYYIAQPYWGQGIMPRAVREACRSVFAHTDILRIYADPFAHNTASCRVLEKAGFVREGVMRCNAVKNGQVIDMVLYALLRDQAV